MARFRSSVQAGVLYPAPDALPIPVGSPAWYAWLRDEQHRSFTMQHPAGTLTVRKERKQRGGWYWSAYRQINGTLHKHYLGTSDTLTLARLHAAVYALTLHTAHAARLVEQHAAPMLQRSDMPDLLRWVAALPDDQIRARPRLCLLHTIALLLSGQVAAAEQRLPDATVSPPTVPMDDDPPTAAERAAVAALLHTLCGSFDTAMAQAEEALAHLPPEQILLRGLAALSLGLVNGLRGTVTDVQPILLETAALGEASDTPLIAALAHITLAGQYANLGLLHQSQHHYQHVLRLTTETQPQPLPIAAMAHIGLGNLLREWNDLAHAAAHMQTGIDLATRWCNPDVLIDALWGMTRVRLAQGNLTDAVATLHAAAHIGQQNRVLVWAVVGPVYRVRLWLAQGNLAAATAWQPHERLPDTDSHHWMHQSVYLNLLEQLALARVRLAQGQPAAALDLLERLTTTTSSVYPFTIEMLIVQARAYQMQGNTRRALRVLGHALTLAEPGGVVRLFVDEGPPLADLLRQVKPRQTTLRAYVQRLRAAFPVAEKAPDSAWLPEPLTAREQDMLTLLAHGHTNGEIANKLVLAESTVKWHLRHLYSKLQARNRMQAVTRARAFGLLPTLTAEPPPFEG